MCLEAMKLSSYDPFSGSHKTVKVYCNGDINFPGKRVIVNQTRVKDLDYFLAELTLSLKPQFGAVRKLYTSDNGNLIQDICQLEDGVSYVAAGIDPFRALNYREVDRQARLNGTWKMKAASLKDPNLAPFKPKPAASQVKPVKHSKIQRSARYDRISSEPVVIHVFENGNNHDRPAKILLRPNIELQSWHQTLELVTSKVRLKSGAVKWLFSVDGECVTNIKDIRSREDYVAVGNGEKFIKLPYDVTPTKPTWLAADKKNSKKNPDAALYYTPVNPDSKKKNQLPPIDSSRSQTKQQMKKYDPLALYSDKYKKPSPRLEEQEASSHQSPQKEELKPILKKSSKYDSHPRRRSSDQNRSKTTVVTKSSNQQQDNQGNLEPMTKPAKVSNASTRTRGDRGKSVETDTSDDISTTSDSHKREKTNSTAARRSFDEKQPVVEGEDEEEEVEEVVAGGGDDDSEGSGTESNEHGQTPTDDGETAVRGGEENEQKANADVDNSGTNNTLSGSDKKAKKPKSSLSDEDTRKHEAATKIQSNVRGHLSRRKMNGNSVTVSG